jgi:hypothetical protein
VKFGSCEANVKKGSSQPLGRLGINGINKIKIEISKTFKKTGVPRIYSELYRRLQILHYNGRPVILLIVC